MAETQRNEPGSGAPLSRPPGARRRLWPLLASAVTVAVVGGGLVARAATDGGGRTCSGPVRTIEVVAAPEVAGVVAQVAGTSAAGSGGCWRADVVAEDSAAAAGRLAGSGAAPPAVWIPDSSLWLRNSLAGGTELPSGSQSLARSPIVLAVQQSRLAELPELDGTRLHPRELMTETAAQLDLALPEPSRSAPALGLVLQLQAAAGDDPAGRVDLVRTLRAAHRGLPADPQEAMVAVAADPRLAVPVSEQGLWQYQGNGPEVPLAPVRLTTGLELDYPFVVLTQDEGSRAAADELLTALRQPDARGLLAARGFRDSDGRPGLALARDLGVDPGDVAAAPVPPAGTADAALASYDAITRDSRILAVLDVSGSMRGKVAGTPGVTRMDLVRAAAAEGLNAYPDGAHIGLWEFATDLTADADHRELVPVGALTLRSDGQTGRQRLARALQDIAPTDGDTGLYDTTLAAVRAMRATYDTRRANVVVVLTDGRNEDARGLSLDELLATLRREYDPRRPVAVSAVAYGPDSDATALRAISEATGGITYETPDPRDVGRVLLDAIARRPAAPAPAR
jgi:Ca-activated chloride channel family protein